MHFGQYPSLVEVYAKLRWITTQRLINALQSFGQFLHRRQNYSFIIREDRTVLNKAVLYKTFLNITV
jgi:hypothetical protein